MIDIGVPAIVLSEIGKNFGAVKALEGVNLTVHPGRVLAVMGHNGAGKSTLTSVIAGWLKPSSGSLSLFGETGTSANVRDRARRSEVRVVFQELSLCPNLSVTENTRLIMPGLAAVGWRKKASALIVARLDEIFPGHGIDPNAKVEDLSIAKKQMVEIARAFVTDGRPPRIVILDEPTSSLGSQAAAQLLAHMRKVADAGMTVFFISHRMDEILGHTDEIVVMRDGTVVAHRPTNEFTHDSLVAQMGMVEPPKKEATTATVSIETEVVVSVCDFRARRGRVVGLAGLDGHGQKQLLDEIYRSSRKKTADNLVGGSLAFVAGDRQNEGIFPLWSIARNISAGRASGKEKSKTFPLSEESKIAENWRQKLSIRAPDVRTLISSLSGGNQQKALVARAFAHEAEIILLDDPLRGVDIGTKREIYAFVREQAAGGRTFIWYSTEIAELENCDEVYVFYLGQISAVLPRSELNEQRVLEASFGRNSSNREVAK